MTSTPFVTRVVLRNYKSIGRCDVTLRPLTYLVGANGSGKSNFLDALHLVRDALAAPLDQALNEHGGLSEVRRKSSGHPTHFGIRLDLCLPDGEPAHYAFLIGSAKGGNFEIQSEQCAVGMRGKGPCYRIDHGRLVEGSEAQFPAIAPDRLALVAFSGMNAFRPVFDALSRMGFYNLNPKLMRELQKPQDGRLLKPSGENIASVISHLERGAPERIRIVEQLLAAIVPSVHGFERRTIGPMETVEFHQDMAGARDPWRFLAHSMSDGTLRALAILIALFQGSRDFAPSLVGIEEPETALHPAASAALREALTRASSHTQVLVTSHSPDLLDDPGIDPDTLLAVVSDQGETRIAPLDGASRSAMRDHLFSAGELLRLNQLAPDTGDMAAQQSRQSDLFEMAGT
ncbi:MAG: AAA family ATPase [Xanthomonadales bacterium]|nr:AAA family ATPase [Xanthomonadales bacterium]